MSHTLTHDYLSIS